MPPTLPIGLSDFRKLRETGAWYADKTSLLVGILDSGTEVFLFPRPRRFGKTLNLSTLRYFVEKPVEPWDATPLFKDLAVWRSEAARKHFQRHPTIALSFKDVKQRDWEASWTGIRAEIARVFRQHRYLLAGLPADEAREFQSYLDQAFNPATGGNALAFLTRLLHGYHGEYAVILVDEYDVPIHAGYLGGFYDEVITFFRTFLTAGLKDNVHLFKGVLTGVLRIAKESIFSGLNNPEVWSILKRPFSEAFGFTEDEVKSLFEALGRPEALDEARRWYDGYRFGGTVLYNPWSVLGFARNPDDGGSPYWVHTSSDDILRHLLLDRGHALASEMGTLLAGGAITRRVDDNIVFADLEHDADAAMSLLLMSGYLTPRAQRNVAGKTWCDLVVPNLEIHTLFETVITGWLKERPGRAENVRVLLQAMLDGDTTTFERHLSDLVLQTFSVHDAIRPQPERVYQAFLLGLLVNLQETHEVRSNREAGYGRYDVMVCPRQPGQVGVVLELKVLDKDRRETRKAALASALTQVRERRYAEELVSRGADPVREYGIVFDGKRVWVGR